MMIATKPSNPPDTTTSITGSQLNEPLKLLGDYRTLVPSHRGNQTHVSTLIRWATRGVRLPSGQRLKLAASRIGNRWYTTDTAFAEFIAGQNPSTETQPALASPTPSQRSRAAEAATRELDQLLGR
jgi:hypothetical protein